MILAGIINHSVIVIHFKINELFGTYYLISNQFYINYNLCD